MSSKVFLILSVGVAFATAVAIPAPQQTTTEGICALPENDPASWKETGAIEFMEAWFQQNTTNDWLAAMDQVTTENPDYNSLINCKTLGTQFCQVPTVDCEEFTPPELRYIRVAASKAHAFFTIAQNKLRDDTIIAGLQLNQIIEHFAPDESPAGFNWVNAISALFFLSSSLFGLAGLTGATALSAVGGSLFTYNAFAPPGQPIDKTDQFEAVLGAQLAAAFQQGQDGITALNSALFGGDGDIDLDGMVKDLSNGGIVATSGLNPITEIFASGSFLADLDENIMNDALEAGFARLRLSLVAGVMKANNYYIHINEAMSVDECNTITGSRFVDGGTKCAIISKRVTADVNAKVLSDGHIQDTEPVAPEILLKLDDSTLPLPYNVDVQKLYDNAMLCGGETLDASLTLSNELPKCFWSLPILRTEGETVCTLIPEGEDSAPGYPEGLQLDIHTGCLLTGLATPMSGF